MTTRSGQHSTGEPKSVPIHAWAELLMLGALSMVPYVVAFVLADGRVSSVPASIERIAEYTVPLLDRFFEAAGLIAAMLVTLAAATAFGRARKRDFADELRNRILVAATGGIVLIALIAACTTPVAIVDPKRWPEVTVVLATAWVLLVGAQLIRFVATPDEQAKSAKRAWRERKSNARDIGVDYRDQETPRLSRITAATVVWCAPVVLWLLVSGLFVATGSPMGVDRGVVFIMSGIVGCGNLLITAGWWAAADASGPKGYRKMVRSFLMTLGAIMTVIFGIALISNGIFFRLAVALFAFTVLHSFVYIVPALRSRVPWLRIVERSSTLAGVKRARRSYRTVRLQAVG